jgi:hypothetical protein
MPTTYTWEIAQLDCYPAHKGAKNVVFNIHWRRFVSDESGRSASAYGTQTITSEPHQSFISFEDLTKSQIELWLVSAMGAHRVADVDASLNDEIEAQASPSVITLPAPWSA